MSPPVIVTGAAGFIGMHVAERLLQRGERVIGVDDFNAYYDPALKAARAARLEANPHFRMKRLDIAEAEAFEDLVRESGATLITLCPGQTPLADLATVNLAIDVQEDTEIYTPLSSRIAHLVVIDVLAMGVAMARGPDLVGHLKSVKRSLRNLRLSPKASRHDD